MVDALSNLLEQVSSLKVSSYATYLDLSDDKKKFFDDLFWNYLYAGPHNVKQEVKNKVNLAVNEEFSVGIKQSILYADRGTMGDGVSLII